MRKLRATISLEWGYEMHSITLAARNWSRIKDDRPLLMIGKGYNCEGQFFWDQWFFAGSSEGDLRVTYGSGGGGVNGTLGDADVSEHE